MGRWDDFDDAWNYYRPDQPIKVTGGLKTRHERGAIGSTWWSKRWIAVLESFSMGTRLTKGRSYARQGQVLTIDIEPGQVAAVVQGSQPKPYKVSIHLQPLSAQDWEKVIKVMAAQAIFAAKLLAGEMPTTIEEAFKAAHLSLFPTRAKDLVTACSCPDWANPCKHTAAVYYLLAERFDVDPFLIFKLRGRTREEIIQALRQKRNELRTVERTVVSPGPEVVSADVAVGAEESLETFWQAGEGLDVFALKPGAPPVEQAILKRLGESPFVLNDVNLTTWLEQAYQAVERAVASEE